MADTFFDQAVEGLPVDLRQTVYKVAMAVQCPIGLALTSVLGTLSSACQASADVMLPYGGVQPIALYTLVLAESGERKTATDHLVSRALRQHNDATLSASAAEEPTRLVAQTVWLAHKRAISAKMMRAIETRRQEDVTKYESELAALLAADPRKIGATARPLLLSEATPTALLETLAGAFRAVTMTSSDGAGILQRAGLETATRLNLLWDGERVTYARKSGNIDIQNGRLTFSLMMQPSVLQYILRRKDYYLRDSGLFARMLVTNPESMQGNRPFGSNPASPELHIFEDRIRFLLRQSDAHLYHRQREILVFADDAKYQLEHFANLVESELTACGQLGDVRDAAAKSVANAARIAAQLHIWQHGVSTLVIDAQTARVACNLAAYYLGEFKRVFGVRPIAQLAQEFGNTLQQWLVAHQGAMPGFQVRKSYIAQSGPNSLRNKEVLDLALQQLSQYGVIAVSTSKPVVVRYLGSGRMPFSRSGTFGVVR